MIKYIPLEIYKNHQPLPNNDVQSSQEIQLLAFSDALEVDLLEIIKSSPLLSKDFAGRAMLVMDRKTEQALGQKIYAELAKISKLSLEKLVFMENISANMKYANILREEQDGCDFLIAVGSGTINDLVKYVAKEEGKFYYLFPTATSMNGYTSATASLKQESDELSTSFLCEPPRAIFVDLATLQKAPKGLLRAGFGDLMAEGSARLDWLFATEIGFLGESELLYQDIYYDIYQESTKKLHQQAELLVDSAEVAVDNLMQTLLYSSVVTQFTKNSIATSGSEHAIAHAFEFLLEEYLLKNNISKKAGRTIKHGELIAITSLIARKIQDKLLHVLAAHLAAGSLQEWWSGVLAAYQSPDILNHKIDMQAYTYKLKMLNSIPKEDIASKLETFLAKSQTLLAQGKVISFQEQAELLKKAGLSIDIKDYADKIKVPPEILQEIMLKAENLAKYLRNRLTVLDLMITAS